MRLWSLHPKYLDAKGLVALWREGLLAFHVLQGKTKGYTKHPQLERFRAHSYPIKAITNYLHPVADEADARGYRFDHTKLPKRSRCKPIPVTNGQLEYETKHLKQKLSMRDKQRLESLKTIACCQPHPLFTVIEGEVEAWEKVDT